MDQPRHVILILRLDRYHEAAVALGDDGLPEVFGLVGGDKLLQNIPDLGGGGPLMAADIGQRGACHIGDLLLGEDGAADLLLQESVGGQAQEQGIHGRFLVAAGGVLHAPPGTAKHRRHIQQLPGIEGAPHIGALQGGLHRAHIPKVGRSPKRNQLHRGGGLGKGTLHIVGIGVGPQLQAPLLPLLGAGFHRQHLQDLGQLQCLNRFFKQVDHRNIPHFLG